MRLHFQGRGTYSIRLHLVSKLVALTHRLGARAEGMAYLAAYIFLLRVPSECLPMIRGGAGVVLAKHKSVISCESGEVILHLAWRKNSNRPVRLTRACWCDHDKATCPFHVFWHFCLTRPVGAAIFPAMTAGGTLHALRERLSVLRVPAAADYGTQDFRRGHARDLQASGSDVATILAAGGWRSAAFLAYLDTVELEKDAVIEAHLGESSDEESTIVDIIEIE